MPVDVGSAVGYLDLDIAGFLKGLTTAQVEADKTTNNIAARAGKTLQGAGNAMASAGKTLTAAVTLPIVGLGTAIVSASSTFEASMSKVKAVSGATGEDFDNLRNKAEELGATTVYSASEVADGMAEMAKAGWNSQQIMDGMAGVLDAATASGESLASVSTIVADAITGFGLEAKDATRVADLLTQSANAGTIDITDLGESFKYIAPIAQTMNFSIEDSVTAITAMSQAGIKGSQAGTGLRIMLTNMVKPTDDLAMAMDELGIVLTESDGSFKSLDDIVSLLRGKFAGMTDEQKTYYATLFAGKEGMSAMLSLLNLTQEEYDAIAVSMDNAGGVARTTAEIMQDNLQGQVKELQSALEGLAIQFGEVILPYLKKFVGRIQDVVTWFSELSVVEKEQVVQLALFAAAVGPVLFILGTFIGVLGKFASTIGEVKGAITGTFATFKTMGTWYTKLQEGQALCAAGFTHFGIMAKASAVQSAVLTAALEVLQLALKAVAALAVIEILVQLAQEFAATAETAYTVTKATQGLTGAMGAMESAYSSSIAAIDSNTSATKSNAETAKEALQAQADLADIAITKWKEVGQNSALVDNYTATIERLSGKSNLTKEEQAELANAVKLFNDECGTSIAVIDPLNGKLSEQTDAILAVASAYKEKARVQAAQELLVETTKAQIQTEIELKKATDELNTSQQGQGIWLGDFAVVADEASVKHKELEDRVKNLTAANDAAKETIEQYNGVINNSSNALYSTVEAVSSFARSNETIVTACEESGKSVDDLSKTLADAGVSTTVLGSLTAEQLALLVQNYDGTATSVINTLRGMSPEVAQASTDAAKSATDAIAAEAPNTGAAAGTLKQSAVNNLDPLKIDMPGVATDSANAFNSALSAGAPESAKSAWALRMAAYDAIDPVTGQLSNVGAAGSMGFAGNLASAEGVAAGNAALMAAASYGMAIYQESAYDWGRHLSMNFADGISCNVGYVSMAAGRLASAVEEQIGHTIAEKGPLHNRGKGEAEWGMHAVLNFVNGAVKAMPMVSKTFAAVAGAVSAELMQRQYASFSGKPFGYGISGQQSGRYVVEKEQKAVKADVFNFYSPKPIDEIEAARQLKAAKRDLAEGF